MQSLDDKRHQAKELAALMQAELEQDVKQRIANRKSPKITTIITTDDDEDTPTLAGSKRRPPMITRNANGRMTPKV